METITKKESGSLKWSYPWTALAVMAAIAACSSCKRSQPPDSKEPVPVTPSQTQKPERLQRGASASTAGGNAVEQIWEEDTYENNLVGDLLKPFDAEALMQLSNDPNRNERQFVELVLRATAERDIRFRFLLNRPELRQEETFDLALSAYAYAVNGNREALHHILAKHAANAAGNGASWDSDTVWVLAYIDEWNLTKAALKSHSLSADGAGGDARYAFWLQRRYLFPNTPGFPVNYQSFCDEVSQNR